MSPHTLPILTACALLACGGPAFGQPPPGKEKKDKPPPDEFRVLVHDVEEAYKAPYEVDKDVLDELRKQYRQPTPEREVKIFKEIRRLYQTTPQQEEVILREVRLAYQQQSPEQEARVFAEIRRADRVPEGTVPESVQAEQAARLFRKLDRDGNGSLSADEMTDALKADRRKWDANRDGSIDPDEYRGYYQASLRVVSEKVAAGEIQIKLPKGVPGPAPKPAEERRPVVARAGKLPAGLPDWFAKFDTDGDGQVGLYEWRRQGRTIKEFVPLDQNDDGYLTPKEVLDYLAEQAKSQPADPRKGGR